MRFHHFKVVDLHNRGVELDLGCKMTMDLKKYKTMYDKLSSMIKSKIHGGEGGIGLFITLVSKVL